jgi:hypothetical protein
LAENVAEKSVVLAGVPEPAIATPAAASASTVAIARSPRRPARGKSVLIESSFVGVDCAVGHVAGRCNFGPSSDDLRAVFKV